MKNSPFPISNLGFDGLNSVMGLRFKNDCRPSRRLYKNLHGDGQGNPQKTIGGSF